MAADTKKGSGGNNQLLMTLLKGRTLIVLAILFVFFSFAAPNFFNVDSLLSVAKHVALYGILAIGMTYVIITGGIDLSVGAVVGFCGMLAGGFLQEGLTLPMFGVTIYMSVPVVVLVTLVIGVLLGVVNGLIITKLGVTPFIATLGTMYVWRGFANIRSNGATFNDIAGKAGRRAQRDEHEIGVLAKVGVHHAGIRPTEHLGEARLHLFHHRLGGQHVAVVPVLVVAIEVRAG